MITFREDEPVDITIHGALVDWHGDHTLTIGIPGWDEQIDIPLVDVHGGPLPAVKITRADIISTPPSPEINRLSVEQKAAIVNWLNREPRSFTDILASAWCATVTETGSTPDEVELVDGSRLVASAHGTGWAPKPPRPVSVTGIAPRDAESVEATHLAGNHGWCDYGTCTKPGCTVSHTQLIELDDDDELLGGGR